MPTNVTKDPAARLDYAWDWTDWLEPAETITTPTVTVTKGDVTIDGSPANVAGVVTVWVKDGTAGTTAWVTCHITTSAQRQDDRTFVISITER